MITPTPTPTPPPPPTRKQRNADRITSLERRIARMEKRWEKREKEFDQRIARLHGYDMRVKRIEVNYDYWLARMPAVVEWLEHFQRYLRRMVLADLPVSTREAERALKAQQKAQQKNGADAR